MDEAMCEHLKEEHGCSFDTKWGCGATRPGPSTASCEDFGASRARCEEKWVSPGCVFLERQGCVSFSLNLLGNLAETSSPAGSGVAGDIVLRLTVDSESFISDQSALFAVRSSIAEMVDIGVTRVGVSPQNLALHPFGNYPAEHHVTMTYQITLPDGHESRGLVAKFLAISPSDATNLIVNRMTAWGLPYDVSVSGKEVEIAGARILSEEESSDPFGIETIAAISAGVVAVCGLGAAVFGAECCSRHCPKRGDTARGYCQDEAPTPEATAA